MAEKKKIRVSKVSRVLTQARESLKLLETLEKETLAKARTFVRNPIKVDRNTERLAASLKSLGFATRAEVERLEGRIEELQAEVTGLREAMASSQSSKKGANKATATRPPSAEAFPNT
jgi:branched-subunit amino acid aminotransferase/4-amino-4-deoxychorismate lyase